MDSYTPTDAHGTTRRRPLQDGGRRRAVLVSVPPRVEEAIAPALEACHLVPYHVHTPEALRDALYDDDPDIVVVYFGRDIPTGSASCSAIRKQPSGQDVPLVAIVDIAAADAYTADCPADEVLLLPCSPEEAGLRLRLAAWRRNAPGGDAVIKVGEIVIDVVGMHVREMGVPVDLTYKEYALLCFLVQNPGVALTRDAILASVWGDDYLGGDRTVDIHVRRLRAKLPTVEARLETIHGIGYRFTLPPDAGDQ
jgi:DNA-binding response OmpR family regulator